MPIRSYHAELRGKLLYLVEDTAKGYKGLQRCVGRIEPTKKGIEFIVKLTYGRDYDKENKTYQLPEAIITWLALHCVPHIHFLTKKGRLVSDLLDWQQQGIHLREANVEQKIALHEAYFRETVIESDSPFAK
jgi:hypothetical protein